jgi:hypothetical protein
MRPFVQLIVFCSLIAGMRSSVAACDVSYDPTAGIASVPCIDVAGEARSLAVFLQATGADTVAVTAVTEFTLADPVIAELRVDVTGFAPTAIVTGFYATCGGGTVSRPTITRVGDNIDVRVKMRVPVVRDLDCEATARALQPFAEAVRFPFLVIDDLRTKIYSINGNRVLPVF